MNRSRTGQIRAFTLIEVLIAMGILSFIVAAIYSSWSAVLRSTKVGMDVAAQAQRTRIAGQAIEQALKTAVMYAENIRYYSFIADTSSEFAAISLTSRLPESFPGGGFFRDNSQMVRRVSFEVLPGTNGHMDLILSQLPYVQYTNDTVKPYQIVLARDITLFFLEFWDTQQGWVEELNTTNQLPKMVRFSLGIGRTANSSKDPAELIVRTVSLPAAPVLADMQMPQPGGAGGGLRPPGIRLPGQNPRDLAPPGTPGRPPGLVPPRGAR